MATPPPEQDQRYNGIVSAGSDLLNQIHIAVIRLDGKTDSLGIRMADFRDEIRADVKRLSDTQRDQEVRLRALQDRDYVQPSTVWKVVGALLSVFGIITTIVIAVVNSKP